MRKPPDTGALEWVPTAIAVDQLQVSRATLRRYVSAGLLTKGEHFVQPVPNSQYLWRPNAIWERFQQDQPTPNPEAN